MENLDHTVNSLRKRIDNYVPPLPAAIIAALMGLCGWLAARAFPMH